MNKTVTFTAKESSSDFAHNDGALTGRKKKRSAVADRFGLYQYFLLSCASASSRVISPELHLAMICTSLSLR